MKKLALAAVLALAGLSSQAATVTFNLSPAQVFQTTEINQNGTLGLFNTNLGTLTNVELTYAGDMRTVITLSNNAAQEQTVEAVGSVALRFNSSLAPLNAIWAAPAPRLLLEAPTGEQLVASGGTFVSGVLTDTETRTLDAALDAFIASFGAAGGGTFGLGCSSLSGITVVGGGGNVGTSQATQAKCDASVTYTYTPGVIEVPEPGSLALVGLALAAASFVARRKA
jgi:hypothetical protein